MQSKRVVEDNLGLVQSQMRQALKDKEQMSQKVEFLESELVQANKTIAKEVKAKENALTEIQQLNDVVNDLEQTIQGLNQDVRDHQDSNEMTRSAID